MKEISGMYLNIFDVFQGAKAQELLFAIVTFSSPTTKQATMVRTLLITLYNLLRNVHRLRNK
jgi:hypothetical protein